ncbi:hypothetical protein ABEG18_20035 [Alsobacter sp. KACC 23698]|uniref:Uncharacterized protein n=1 Tax=Alsobacter sp. KACC 23698 TaxID=3149229 RepID=A0AAU7JCR9_9HYPH
MIQSPAHGFHDAMEPPLSGIDPDWERDWAPSIASPALRARIAEDPRLRPRIPAMLAAARDAGRLELGALTAADLRAYRTCIADPGRFRHVLGLAWHARMLNGVIDGEHLRALAGLVTPGDLLLLVQFSDMETECEELPQPSRFEQAVTACADRLLRAWAETLPTAYAARIAFCLPKIINNEIEKLEFANHCLPNLIHRVAELLYRP